MTIVTAHYRYKRPPRKRKPNPAALAMPTIVTAKKPKPHKPGDPPIRRTSDAAPSPAPTNDDRKPAIKVASSDLDREPSRAAYTKSAIVAVRSRKHARLGDVPDMTPEEHKRRGDAADALWREMKRRIAEKQHPS